MQLDNPTMMVATGVSSIVCALARVMLHRLHPAIPGLRNWAAAGVLGTITLTIIAMEARNPNHWGHSVAQALMLMGFVLVWDGFRRFIGQSPLSRAAIAVCGLIVLAPTMACQIAGNLPLRMEVNSGLVAAFSILIARDLFHFSTKPQKLLRITAVIYILNALYFLIRIYFSYRAGEMVVRPGGGLDAGITFLWEITLLWFMGLTVSTTFCMVLITGERLQAALNDQANRDPLTGALNRRAFRDLGAMEMARAERSHVPLGMLMMDLDHFKTINDRLGHAVGDQMLCLFVDETQSLLRAGDLLCRFGGEEFVALLLGSDLDQTKGIAERLCVAFAQEANRMLDTPSLAPTVSVGIAQWRLGEDIDQAMLRADQALYRAKANGRNRVECEEGRVSLSSE